MKRYIIMAGLLLLAAACTGCGKKEKTEEAGETSSETGEIQTTVLDNDQVKLVYNGFEADTEGLMFTITNKTDATFNIYFKDVAVNGETLEPMFGFEVAAGETADQICLVDCTAAIPVLNGIVCLETADYEMLGQYSVDDISLPDGGTEDKTAYAVKDGAVTVLDNDTLTVSYIGPIETEADEQDTDEEDPEEEEVADEEEDEQGFLFEVYNKSGELLQVTFDSILVNGEEEEPSYMIDVMGETFGVLTCDVSDVNGVSGLTAQMSVYDANDNLVDTYTIENVEFK